MDTEKIEDQRFYFRVWQEVLSNLLGYTRAQIDQWVALNCKSWDEFHSVYVSEFPEYWVTDALISNHVREKIAANEVSKLKRDIVDAIESGDPKWCSNEAYDWSAARHRVGKVFAKYGVSFIG